MSTCPACGNKDYVEAIHVEVCNSCGYAVDYSGGGCNDIAKAHHKREEEKYYERLNDYEP